MMEVVEEVRTCLLILAIQLWAILGVVKGKE